MQSLNTFWGYCRKYKHGERESESGRVKKERERGGESGESNNLVHTQHLNLVTTSALKLSVSTQ
jgi:hypothetical protein